MVGAADLDPGDLLGVAHAPLMHAPIGGFQRTKISSVQRAPIDASCTDDACTYVLGLD